MANKKKKILINLRISQLPSSSQAPDFSKKQPKCVKIFKDISAHDEEHSRPQSHLIRDKSKECVKNSLLVLNSNLERDKPVKCKNLVLPRAKMDNSNAMLPKPVAYY